MAPEDKRAKSIFSRLQGILGRKSGRSRGPQKDLVLVTGAAGFIATHVIKLLLEQGYRVRGADIVPPEKITHLQKWIKEGKSLELVQADLLRAETWPAALAGCKYVVHMAAVVKMDIPDDQVDDKLVRPAVEGTLNVLRACAAAGTVQRVVMTSSVGAVGDEAAIRKQALAGQKIDAEMWAATNSTPYCRSKGMSERAAWDFVRSEAGQGLELVCINPGIVVGHSLGTSVHESMRQITSIVTNSASAVPQIAVFLASVHDVAAAHVRAMTTEAAVGKRFILVQHPTDFLGICQHLKATVGPLSYRIPDTPMSEAMFKVVQASDPGIARSAPLLGIRPTFDCTPAQEILGFPSDKDCMSDITDLFADAVRIGHVHRTKLFVQWDEARSAAAAAVASNP